MFDEVEVENSDYQLLGKICTYRWYNFRKYLLFFLLCDNRKDDMNNATKYLSHDCDGHFTVCRFWWPWNNQSSSYATVMHFWISCICSFLIALQSLNFAIYAIMGELSDLLLTIYLFTKSLHVLVTFDMQNGNFYISMKPLSTIETFKYLNSRRFHFW